MTDDIVTRLRGLNTASYHLLCNEAADEIERWRKIATELYTWLLPSDEDDSVREAGLDAMAMYDEAVRGE